MTTFRTFLKTKGLMGFLISKQKLQHGYGMQTLHFLIPVLLFIAHSFSSFWIVLFIVKTFGQIKLVTV